MGGKNSGIGTKPTDLSKRFRADFFQRMDGRVTAVKALRERFNALTTDLGGLDNLSYQEKTLCKRAIFLERHIEGMELLVTKGGAVEVHSYIASINALSGILSRIGLKRRAKQISLRDYLTSAKSETPAVTPSPPQSGVPIQGEQ